MNISDEGVRLVCSFEGYHKKLANGESRGGLAGVESTLRLPRRAFVRDLC